jgi:hypothetical protein
LVIDHVCGAIVDWCCWIGGQGGIDGFARDGFGDVEPSAGLERGDVVAQAKDLGRGCALLVGFGDLDDGSRDIVKRVARRRICGVVDRGGVGAAGCVGG